MRAGLEWEQLFVNCSLCSFPDQKYSDVDVRLVILQFLPAQINFYKPEF